jgi:hypothetical protein
LNAFTKLALSSPIASVRTAAVTFVSVPGEAAQARPVPGTVAKLTAIYRRATDEAVQLVILRALTRQAEVTKAVEFLTEISESGSAQDHHTVLPPVHALQSLSLMGERGRAALQRLSREGRVRSPPARDYLNHLGQRPF